MQSSTKSDSGPTRKLVLAMDVGTTFSGVSYSLFEPGNVPKVLPVPKYPAQEAVGGNMKIPSVLFYDAKSKPRAIGAETLLPAIIEQANREHWIKVEWFKLHLRPKALANEADEVGDLKLPKNKTAVGVYADFLKYLLECTRKHLETSHPSGQTLWDLLEDNIEYILTHPNGWEGSQQKQLRQAAVEAGFVSDNAKGHERIQFLTEGEASLHYCVKNGLGTEIITDSGKGIIIVDAGGGTVDINAFAPLEDGSFEEISVPKCIFQGSIYVTRRATTYLKEKFAKSKFKDDVPIMADAFDRTAKLLFSNEDEPAYIRFGGLRDKDLDLGVRAGQLTLRGSDVAGFFRPSVAAITEAIQAQIAAASKPISNIFLVGGFGSSLYLFSALQKALESQGIKLGQPDGYLNKAVADGAVHFYIERLVSRRVSRFDYGSEGCIPFHPLFMSDRAHQVFIDHEGDPAVPGFFHRILKKGTQVSTTETFSLKITKCSFNPTTMNDAEIEIKRYHGNLSPCPLWLDIDEDNFTTHCKVTGNLSGVPKIKRWGPLGLYYTADVQVNITFGPAEMKAHLSWEEKGMKKCGPAQVLYDDQ